MFVAALRTEADEYILQALGERDENGRQVVVGNGYGMPVDSGDTDPTYRSMLTPLSIS